MKVCRSLSGIFKDLDGYIKLFTILFVFIYPNFERWDGPSCEITCGERV